MLIDDLLTLNISKNSKIMPSINFSNFSKEITGENLKLIPPLDPKILHGPKTLANI